MSYGLEVYDAAGLVSLALSDRITRFVATYSGTICCNETVDVSVPGLVDDGTWAVHLAGDTRFIELTLLPGIVRVRTALYVSNPWQFAVFRF